MLNFIIKLHDCMVVEMVVVVMRQNYAFNRGNSAMLIGAGENVLVQATEKVMHALKNRVG